MPTKKTPPWTPPPEAVGELLDAASYKLKDDEIVLADIQKPQCERLRELLSGMLAFSAEEDPMESSYGYISKDRVFACLKDALVRAKGEHEACEAMRKSYQRDENAAEYRLENLKAVAREMLDAYGTGSEKDPLHIDTPIGAIRYQRNSKGSVWLDESQLDKIPEEVGQFKLVRVTRTPLKEGIGQWLEDLPEIDRPEWAKLLPPGWHLRF